MANYWDGMDDGKHSSENTETSTPSFKVSLTFDCVDAKNPLEAAKTVLSWILNTDKDKFLGGAEKMCYDVINEKTNEAFTVDLDEEDEYAVLPN
jgi:hypothetical protein